MATDLSRLRRLALYRHLTQALALLSIGLIPYLHLIRLETDTGRIYWFGRAMPLGMTLHTGAPVVLLLFLAFWVSFIFFLLSLSFLMEKAFCAYLCPGNSLPELADHTHRYFTGKRYRGDRYPHERNPQRTPLRSALHLAGWLLLLSYLTWALLSYFFSTGGLVRGLSTGSGLAFWLFLALFALLTVWIFGVRHGFCPWCPFGVFYQWLFAYITGAIKYSLPGWGDSYRIRFLKERAPTCVHCNLCERVCPTNVPVMSTDGALACVSCGLCVDECAKIMARRELPPVIDYSSVAQRHRVARHAADTFPWGRRVAATAVLLTVSLAIITFPAYGFASYPVSLQNWNAQATVSSSSFSYDLSVANDTLKPTGFRVVVGALPPGVPAMTLKPGTFTIPPMGRQEVILSTFVPGDGMRFHIRSYTISAAVYDTNNGRLVRRLTLPMEAYGSER